MDTAHLLFLAVSLLASLVSGLFGLGTALLVIALGANLLPVVDTIVLATVLFTASTITKSLIYRQDINWKLAVFMTMASMPFSYLGASLLPLAPVDLIRKLLGGMILLYLIFTRIKPDSPPAPVLQHRLPALAAGSACYGFLSGLLGSGNLVKAIIFSRMKLIGPSFVGIMAATSVMSNLTKLVAFHHADLIAVQPAIMLVSLIIIAITAALISRYLLVRINTRYFQLGITIIMFLSALALLF